jgi:lipoprotein NlpD
MSLSLSSSIGAFALVSFALLAGCAAPVNRAPVEERAPVRDSAVTAPAASLPVVVPAAPVVEVPRPLPGVENLGKPGYYAVKPGDTLMRVALETGQNWRDIARWNGIDNPNVLEVGQVLRVVAPGIDPSSAAARAVVPGARVEARPLDPRAPGAAASAPAPAAAASAPVVATAAPAPAAPGPAAPSAARDADDDIAWSWPTTSSVATPFDEVRTKGLQFTGKPGDAVLAAADGRVIYAGSGLRGYGNMVIVKHNNSYLTAYAHNQALLVKEDQAVRRGQKIAEMGSSDAERVQLHFEIRRLGKPVDPAKLLPPR